MYACMHTYIEWAVDNNMYARGNKSINQQTNSNFWFHWKVWTFCRRSAVNTIYVKVLLTKLSLELLSPTARDRVYASLRVTAPYGFDPFEPTITKNILLSSAGSVKAGTVSFHVFPFFSIHSPFVCFIQKGLEGCKKLRKKIESFSAKTKTFLNKSFIFCQDVQTWRKISVKLYIWNNQTTWRRRWRLW